MTMAKLDIKDDSRRRYVISRHAFDPKTKHYIWIPEMAFTQKREWHRHMKLANSELEKRYAQGLASPKEQIAGHILEPTSERLTPSIYRFLTIFRRKRYLPAYEDSYLEYERGLVFDKEKKKPVN